MLTDVITFIVSNTISNMEIHVASVLKNFRITYFKYYQVLVSILTVINFLEAMLTCQKPL